MDEIEGQKAFFKNDPAWHGKGTVIRGRNVSIDEAWRLSYPHRLFEVGLEAAIGEGADRQFLNVDTHKAIVRDDERILGIVGIDYCLEQPWEILDKRFRPFVETGQIELEAGGSLREGSVFWMLGKIKGASADIIKGDQVDSYLLVVTSFDGSLAYRIQFTAVRVVCANTLAAAIDSALSEKTFKAKHSKHMKDRVANAIEQIDIARATFDRSVEQYQQLARTKMSDAKQAKYFTDVLISEDPEKVDNASERLKNKVRYVIDLRDIQREKEPIPAMRGTAWEGYNAVTRYLTHDYGRNQDTRLAGQWFGESAKVNDRALAYALQ